MTKVVCEGLKGNKVFYRKFDFSTNFPNKGSDAIYDLLV